MRELKIQEGTKTEMHARKTKNYFGGVRKSFVDNLPISYDSRLLDIGCGNGETAYYALATNKCGYCVGIELCEEPAAEARKKLNQVIVGDIELIDLPHQYQDEKFDIVILSEVLEHLYDPQSTLIKIKGAMKTGGIILAGSPNVAHWTTLRMLIRGKWEYAHEGTMDQTHIRWFTPESFQKIFEESGYRVEYIGPASQLRKKARILDLLTFHWFQYLFYTQIFIKAIRL